jgi:hypothetical protein
MSRSKDQSRPFQVGRHRAEAAPVSTKPLTPPSPDAEVPNAEPAPTEPASAGLRRNRARRPAFEVPPAPETAPVAKAPPVPEPKSSAPEIAPATAPMVTQQSRARGDAAEEPLGTTPAATPGDEPVTALSPQVAAFSSQPHAVLRKAASVRIMGHRMAVVAGAFAVLLGVGAATQAAELPFFGKESSAQDAARAPDATVPTSGTRPTSATSPASPQAAASTPPGTSSGTPAQAAPGTDGVPAAANPRATTLPTIASLPMPVDVPTLAGIVAATSAAAPPSSNLQPPTVSSTTPTSPTETTAPATAPAPTPIAASPAPSPTTATATAPVVEVGDAEDTVDTYAYASDRLASYGWGAEQMTALNTLWDTSTKWHPSQVDRGLSYIKQRYGSPAEALEFRAANNWY